MPLFKDLKQGEEFILAVELSCKPIESCSKFKKAAGTSEVIILRMKQKNRQVEEKRKLISECAINSGGEIIAIVPDARVIKLI